jgi:predicted nucleic acid-binding protein
VTIRSGARVALDTPVLIYALEHHPIHGHDAMALLRRIEIGDLVGIASVLILTEFLTAIFARFDPVEARKIRSALSALKITFLPVTEPIAVEAARLRAVYTLRTPDALHVATALAGRADVLVTNDKRLDRVAAEGVRVVMVGP